MNSNSDSFCGKVYHKYLYLVGVTAVLVMIGSYWYIEYYNKGIGISGQAVQQAGVGGRAMPGPRFNNPGQPPANSQGFSPIPQGQQIAAVAPTLDNGNTFAMVVRTMMPSVVNVSATNAKNPDPAVQGAPPKQPGLNFARPFSGIAQESIGSGIIVTEDGYVLTNFHVVEQARHISVTVFNAMGTKRYHADVIGRDEMRDLALLKIVPDRPLIPAALGDSEKIQVGDSVIAIGSPFGLDQTVSKGIVSGKNKIVNIGGTIHKGLLQTDAAINRGNSGGPLVDRGATVIAINTAIYTTTSAFAGVGFAIPMKMAKDFLEELITLPNVKPAFAGQAMGGMPVAAVNNGAPPITPDAIMPHGDRGPCESCHEILPAPQPVNFGVMPNGQGQGSFNQFGQQMGAIPVAAPNNGAPPITADAPMPHGDRGPCETCHEILPSPQPVNFGLGPQGGRGQRNVNQFSFTPGGAIGLPAANVIGTTGWMGASLQQLDQASAIRLQSPVPAGVLTLDVQPGSAFERAGLMGDDILFKLNGRRIASVEDLESLLVKFDPGEQVRVSIIRNGERQDLQLTIERPGAQTVALQQPQTFNGQAGNAPPANSFAAQQAGNGAMQPRRANATPGGAGPALTEFEWMGLELSPIKQAKTAANQGKPGANQPPPPSKRGALVAEVDVGTAGQRAGIKAKDIIIAINGQPVDTAARLDNAIKSVAGQAGVLLEVDRGGQRMFTVLQ
ncbi:MAG: trypsin-like peptidase domain-containing protein [Magnetococcales bacterium]|nr:trypsin-like peptidase domain-containing protein [Magnetococcales bacterium]